jgi:hypothetical protein
LNASDAWCEIRIITNQGQNDFQTPDLKSGARQWAEVIGGGIVFGWGVAKTFLETL